MALYRAGWFAFALLASTSALAQFKVVGPDGKVTYTDRPPPAATGATVNSVRATGGVNSDVTLPLEVRQAAQKFPVTLYTGKDCAPCDDARTLLRTRGVPFNERTVDGNQDADALQKVTGGYDLPTLMIGAQAMRGLEPERWNSYLDTAGYPRESRLPANYAPPAAAPLVARTKAAASASEEGPTVVKRPVSRVSPAPGTAQPADNNPGIKF